MTDWLRGLWSRVLAWMDADLAKVEMDSNCAHQPIGHCPDCAAQAGADRW